MSGVQEIRKNHDLNENSVVFEVGGHIGDFSSRMMEKFNCYIYIFEPIKSLYEHLVNLYKNNPKIKVFNYGLENFNGTQNISLLSEGSSLYSLSNSFESVEFKNINEVLNELNLDKIDLIELNCEGSEFSIIHALTNGPYISKIDRIQIQFHKLFSDSEQKRESCQKLLSLTHNQIWNMEWDWECWELKK